MVIEGDDEGTDTVQASVNYTLSDDDVENLTLTGAAVSGTGNASDNVIIGNSATNFLDGGDGNDILDGGGGSDVLSGGDGNDTYVVDTALDSIDEDAGEGTADEVQSSVTFTLTDPDLENLTLTGVAVINGTGNAGANVITGNDGNNVLAGLGDADELIGGLGTDTATYAASAAGVTVSLRPGTERVAMPEATSSAGSKI